MGTVRLQVSNNSKCALTNTIRILLIKMLLEQEYKSTSYIACWLLDLWLDTHQMKAINGFNLQTLQVQSSFIRIKYD